MVSMLRVSLLALALSLTASLVQASEVDERLAQQVQKTIGKFAQQHGGSAGFETGLDEEGHQTIYFQTGDGLTCDFDYTTKLLYCLDSARESIAFKFENNTLRLLKSPFSSKFRRKIWY